MTDTAMDYPETSYFSFDKPLSPQAVKTLDSLMKRYTDGEGNPLVRFETDTLVTLRIPRTIKPAFLEQKHAQA